MILALSLGGLAANAGPIESLVFTGTATCELGFAYQECSGGSGGPITGSYNLDLNAQTIVGGWSFTTPYGVLSSSMTGASAGVTQQTLSGVTDDEAYFQIYTTTPGFNENLALYFTAPNNSEQGLTSFFGNSFGGLLCQNVPGLASPGCEPDVDLAGSTTVSGITGTIGGLGSEDYYSFVWAGGAFSAAASITGANTGASYLFSEGVAGLCSSGGNQTLNGGDSFSGTIAIASLAPGTYCIGIDANNSNDSALSLTFNTPVEGLTALTSTPEPTSFVLLSVGLVMIGGRLFARRSRRPL